VKGGIGTTSLEEGGAIVGALFAVNALGEIVGEDGEVEIGARPGSEGGEESPVPSAGNTTIGVVATNAKLSKERAQLLAQAGHEGIDLAIRPSHTIWDGDTVFTLATGEVEAPQAMLEELAARAVAEAIRRGVRLARGIPGVPGVGEAV
jgi:L-aminopeptidase/D-esterase-like protein